MERLRQTVAKGSAPGGAPEKSSDMLRTGSTRGTAGAGSTCCFVRLASSGMGAACSHGELQDLRRLSDLLAEYARSLCGGRPRSCHWAGEIWRGGQHALHLQTHPARPLGLPRALGPTPTTPTRPRRKGTGGGHHPGVVRNKSQAV